jgi:predicted TIM-barrel fold metal-dependent hydrolase
VIDCQSHLFSPELLTWMERRINSPRVFHNEQGRHVVVGQWVRRILPNHTDVRAKLAAMDAACIDMAAMSINDPGPELFDADGLEFARRSNDFIAEVVRSHPTRFFGLAVLPMQDMTVALVELERCVSKLGFRGILLYSNLGGRFPDEPPFQALFQRAEEMDIPILLHPAYPVTYDATCGYQMAAGLGLMFDTTIALTRLILSGTLERHPRLKLVCPHVGGALPYLIGRIDHQTQVLKRGAEHIRRPPSDYLRQVWLDTVTPLPQAIRYAFDMVGPDRMLFGSDHPWVDPQMISGNIRSLGLGVEAEQKIFHDNAKKLFRL